MKNSDFLEENEYMEAILKPEDIKVDNSSVKLQLFLFASSTLQLFK